MGKMVRTKIASTSTPFADTALLRAGKALALTGYDVLTDVGFLEAARAEFATTLGYPPMAFSRKGLGMLAGGFAARQHPQSFLGLRL
jgi:hypothetical protein